MTEPVKLEIVRLTWVDVTAYAVTTEPLEKPLHSYESVGFLIPGDSDGCVRVCGSYGIDPDDGEIDYQDVTLIPECLVTHRETVQKA